MFKKIGIIALMFVLILTTVGFSSENNYDRYTLSGNSAVWQVNDAVLIAADTTWVLNPGNLTYAIDEVIAVDYLEINILDLETNETILLSNDYYVDYSKNFNNQDTFVIGGGPISFENYNSISNLAIEITYSLAANTEIIKEVIELN